MYIIIAGSDGTGFRATNLEVFPKKNNFKLAIEWSLSYSIREGNLKKINMQEKFQNVYF